MATMTASSSNTYVCTNCGRRNSNGTLCPCRLQQPAQPVAQPQTFVIQQPPVTTKKSNWLGGIALLIIAVICFSLVMGLTQWKDTPLGAALGGFFAPFSGDSNSLLPDGGQPIDPTPTAKAFVASPPTITVAECTGASTQDSERLSTFIVEFRDVKVGEKVFRVPNFLADDGTIGDNFPSFNGREYLLICFIPTEFGKWGEVQDGANLKNFLARVGGTVVDGSLEKGYFLFYLGSNPIVPTAYQPAANTPTPTTAPTPTPTPEYSTFIEPLPTATPIERAMILADPEQLHVEWEALVGNYGVGAIVWEQTGTELWCETIRAGGSSCLSPDGTVSVLISGLPNINNVAGAGYQWGTASQMRLTLGRVDGAFTWSQASLWPVFAVTQPTPAPECQTIDFGDIVSTETFDLNSVGGTLTYDGTVWRGGGQCFVITNIERLGVVVTDLATGLIGTINYWEVGATISLNPIVGGVNAAATQWWTSNKRVLLLYEAPFIVR